jgi:glycosyltransferase involved in cell wall biosynthesis
MIRPHGGWKSVLVRAMGVYHRDGITGVVERIRQFVQTRQVNPTQGSGRHDRNDYVEWGRRYDTLDENAQCAIAASIDVLSEKPLISVVMPTYNPNPVWLIAAIESVRAQSYPNWELCIADDASTDAEIRPLLEQIAAKDSRIKVVFRRQNGHISEASNTALTIATGSWIALLDHDDLLNKQALFQVADAINRHRDVRMIYSDEDKIDEAGNRFEPYFKCDWNLDLFYSQNLFSHLGVYHSDLLRAVGGFRKGLEGSQDYDLALRCIERINPDQIHHIPYVLYHWRVHAESTARSGDAKPYAVVAGERALNEHFVRRSIAARAEVSDYGYRVHYALPATPPRVSLIIRTGNDLVALRRAVSSILEKTAYSNYEILLVNTGVSSGPGGLADDAKVRTISIERGLGLGAAVNSAFREASGDVIGLLDSSIEVTSAGWLSEMVSLALQPGVGAVGGRLLCPAGAAEQGGMVLGLGKSHIAGFAHHRLPRYGHGYFGRAQLISSFSAVSGRCLVIRSSIFAEVSGLNEADLQSIFSEVDFCLRVISRGYRNVWTPYAELKCHASRPLNVLSPNDIEVGYMKDRWGDFLDSDPAYSLNLSLENADFSLAWPPRHRPIHQQIRARKTSEKN